MTSSLIWGLNGQPLGWNGTALKAPFPIPFIITGGSNITPKYTYDLGANWIPVDTTTGSYGGSTAAYGITGQYKHVWSLDGIHMFFTSYNPARTKSRIWYSNDGGKTMSFFDLTDASPYEGRQFGTWVEDTSRAYITGWTNFAKFNYTDNYFANVLESSTGQSDGNYPLILCTSKDGKYVYGGAAGSGGVICSSTYGSSLSFALKSLTGSGHTQATTCDDSGQYAMVHGDVTFGLRMTFDYGANWSLVSVNTPTGVMFYDATMFMYITRTAPTNYFNFSTNQGGSWTSISLPSGVTNAAVPLIDNKNKIVYLYQGNTTPATLWKLNSAKNGWDNAGTFASNIAMVGVSEIGRGVVVVTYNGHIWFSPSPSDTGSWMDIGTTSDAVGTVLKHINVI